MCEGSKTGVDMHMFPDCYVRGAELDGVACPGNEGDSGQCGGGEKREANHGDVELGKLGKPAC